MSRKKTATSNARLQVAMPEERRVFGFFTYNAGLGAYARIVAHVPLSVIEPYIVRREEPDLPELAAADARRFVARVVGGEEP